MIRSIIIFVALISCNAAMSQSGFEKAILKGKQMMAGADSTGQQQAYNYFQRIANKEGSEWLPLYYQSQILAFKGSDMRDPAEKESTLNSALALIEEAKKIEKNPELIALEGFVQMLRLTVDPGTRGQTLSPTIFGLYNEALKLDPANPRALLFLGQMQHGTAQFFGSGFEEACGNIRKAYDIFEKQPDEPTIYPSWGMESAKAVLANCNQ